MNTYHLAGGAKHVFIPRTCLKEAVDLHRKMMTHLYLEILQPCRERKVTYYI